MADILINGMEMPKEGHYYLEIFCDGEIRRLDNISEGFKDTEAKAVALPSHGRLIDVDALEGILDEVNGYGGASEITYKKMIEILHDEILAPVIVEASNG